MIFEALMIGLTSILTILLTKLVITKSSCNMECNNIKKDENNND